MAITEPVVQESGRASRHWKFPVSAFAVALLVLAGIGVFLYPQAAAWTTQKNQAAALAVDSEQTASGGQGERDARLEEARRYNEALASGALLQANANVPTGDDSGTGDYDYLEMLKSPTDIMARLRYERAGIDLPVYHGTSDRTLLRGVGHLKGTSLPVGGIGTRSVLTGHRGLAGATMFTHLDRARVGDVFTIEVEGQALSYRVFDVQIIEPEDTETLRADPERDLVTLITCTPLGINTERIVVTGERILPTPSDAVDNLGRPSDLPGFPWWAVIFGATLFGSAAYVWRSGYPPKPKKS